MGWTVIPSAAGTVQSPTTTTNAAGCYFKQPDGQFPTRTDDPDQDFFNLGIGATANFAAGTSGFILYEKRLGQANITLDTVRAGLRFEF